MPVAKRGTMDSTKNEMLAATLGVGKGLSFGCLTSIWQRIAKDYPTGRLTRNALITILKTTGWDKMIEPDKFITAASHPEHQWLDPLEDGSFYIHDWHEHADDAVHATLYRSVRTFGNGSRPKAKKISRDEKEELDRLWQEMPPAGQRQPAGQPARLPAGQPTLPLPSSPSPSLPDAAGAGQPTAAEPAAPTPSTQGDKYGPNKIPKAKDTYPVLALFKEHLHQPILEIAAAYQFRRYGGVNPAEDWYPDLLREVGSVLEISDTLNTLEADTEKLLETIRIPPNAVTPRDSRFQHLAFTSGVKKKADRGRDSPDALSMSDAVQQAIKNRGIT